MLRSAFAIVLCLLFVAPLAQSVAAEEAQRIAVVNIARVFDAYLKTQAIKESLKQLVDKRNEEFKTEERALKDLEYKLSMDPRDPKTSVELLKDVQAFNLRRFEFEGKLREFMREKNQREVSAMKSVVDDIQLAVETLRKSENLDLILRAPEGDPRKIEAQTVDEFVLRWRESQVLSVAPKVDVTAKIITSLNEEYKKGGR